MPSNNDRPNDTPTDSKTRKDGLYSRRRWLQLAGAGLVAGSVGVPGVAAGASTRRLEIVAGDSVEYEFTTSEKIEKVFDNGDNSAEKKNDTVSKNDDGTWTVTGLTGNGYGDTFDFRGDALDFKIRSGDCTLYLDGKQVTVEELIDGDTSRTLEIVADESVEYEFTTSEKIQKVFDNGKNSAEKNNDSVTENSDGTWTATGLTGNGYGDTFDFWGDALEFEILSGACTLFLDGQQVTIGELVGEDVSRTLEIVAENGVEYAFTTSGTIEKDLDNGTNSAEKKNDTVTQNDDGTWTVTGLTGNGYGDTFDFWGDALEFEILSGACTLYLDGQQVTVEDLTGRPLAHMVEIVTPADGSIEYSFTTTGRISKVFDNGDNSANENEDVITENDDGTWTATGYSENGYGDSFEFVGEITTFDALGQGTLYLDGEESNLWDLNEKEIEWNRLEIVTPDDGSIEYTFSTTGELRKDLDNGDNSAEKDNDVITENSDGTWTVTGLTGNGYGDTFEFQGSPIAFDPKEGTFSLYLNGKQVTAYELIGEEEPKEDTSDDSTTDDSTSDGSTSDGSTSDGSTETPLGGGAGYPNTVERSQADFVVRNASELESALSSASSGEIVFVTGDSTIDLGNGGFQVPSGVTLASNRGVNDAPGALLYTDLDADECIHLYGDARFTGIRLRGAHPGDDTSGDGSADGVETRGANEVDNCDIYGFTHGGVKVETGGDAHIHHNVIRECNRGGYGYGVTVESGYPLIEYNYFNYNRHSIATAGDNPGYESRYNHFGPLLTDHIMDAHEPAGQYYEIHHNVVEGYIAVEGGGREGLNRPAVTVRDVPADEAHIHDNWFWNPELPEPGTWGGTSIAQPRSSSFESVNFDSNYYGENAGPTFDDVIPGYDGSRS